MEKLILKRFAEIHFNLTQISLTKFKAILIEVERIPTDIILRP